MAFSVKADTVMKKTFADLSAVEQKHITLRALLECVKTDDIRNSKSDARPGPFCTQKLQQACVWLEGVNKFSAYPEIIPAVVQFGEPIAGKFPQDTRIPIAVCVAYLIAKTFGHSVLALQSEAIGQPADHF